MSRNPDSPSLVSPFSPKQRTLPTSPNTQAKVGRKASLRTSVQPLPLTLHTGLTLGRALRKNRAKLPTSVGFLGSLDPGAWTWGQGAESLLYTPAGYVTLARRLPYP